MGERHKPGKLKAIAEERNQTVEEMMIEMLQLYGATSTIAIMLGVSQNTVRNWLENNLYKFNKEANEWQKKDKPQ